MLCDAPQYYEAAAECTKFIADVPTVWDETVALDGKVAEYIVMARRKGEDWYIGGLNAHKPMTVTVDLPFLGEGEWTVELFRDGANADRHGEDYKRVVNPAGNKLTVDMASGGGFAAKITRKK